MELSEAEKALVDAMSNALTLADGLAHHVVGAKISEALDHFWFAKGISNSQGPDDYI